MTSWSGTGRVTTFLTINLLTPKDHSSYCGVLYNNVSRCVSGSHHPINCETDIVVTRQQPIINIRNMYWVSAFRPQWVVNWGHNILATIPRLITKYWVKCHERRAMLGLSGHKATGPVIGIHWRFTARYFPGFIECGLCDAATCDICHDDPWSPGGN